MPNSATKCCGCNCVGRNCARCAVSPDVTLNGYTAVISGVTPSCVESGCPGPLCGQKVSDPNGTYCLPQAIPFGEDVFIDEAIAASGGASTFRGGACIWQYSEGWAAAFGGIAHEMRIYTAAGCTSPVPLWDDNPAHVGTRTVAFAISLIRNEFGGFDCIITQWVYVGGFDRFIGAVVFAGRNNSVANCNSTFTITNGTHPTFPSPESTGGTAVFTPCMKDCKYCYQTWTANYDCTGGGWSVPIKGDFLCLPVSTDQTGWTRTSPSSTNSCSYAIHVKADPPQKCKVDAVCAGLHNTTPPSQPISAPLDCCQCESTHRCFQTWSAIFNCETQEWTNLAEVDGGIVCLPDDTVQTWHKVGPAFDGSPGCEYQIYNPMNHCCSADADCAAFGDPVTPPTFPPLGGLAPSDCCVCDTACVSDTSATCCSSFLGSDTPDTVEAVVNVATQSANCSFDGSGNVVKSEGSGIATLSIIMTRSGCDYSGEVDATGFARILACTGTPGGACGACTPTTDIISGVKLRCTWTPGSPPAFELFSPGGTADRGDCTIGITPFCATGSIAMFIGSTSVLTNSFQSCCLPFTVTWNGPDGSEPFDTFYITSATFIPCP